MATRPGPEGAHTGAVSPQLKIGDVPLSGQHIVIAGAGIIGFACALELAAAGAAVTVLDRGRAMEQASWAAAGMLAVDDPENAPEMHALARLSRALYPAFLARIAGLSGLEVPLRTSATLQGHYGAGTSEGSLPGLRTDRYRFTLIEEASLDPRDLCAALPAAARSAGVTLFEHTAVTRVGRVGSWLQVESEHDAPIAADHFVLAAGAWSSQIELPPDALVRAPLPIAPRKGQMIEVALDGPGLPLVIRTPELYLVPRGDGRVVIGATIEHAAFDRSIDEGAGDRLWQAAAALWPPVLEGRITARWTGLRPGFNAGIADALPVLGSLGENLWAATAHFRNGILLAPATARLLGELLAGQPPSIPLEPFAPARFTDRR